jgi:hemerythrin-like metal-binding protein
LNGPPASALLKEMEVALLLVDNNSVVQRRSRKKRLVEITFEDLSVGIESIDEEHQRLLTLVQRLNASDPVSSPKIVKEILTDLRDYTVRHFRHEETIFKGTDYPHIDEHVSEHEAMINKVKLMSTDADNVHPGNLAELLDEWIVNHIQVRDRELTSYVRKQYS